MNLLVYFRYNNRPKIEIKLITNKWINLFQISRPNYFHSPKAFNRFIDKIKNMSNEYKIQNKILVKNMIRVIVRKKLEK